MCMCCVYAWARIYIYIVLSCVVDVVGNVLFVLMIA